MSRVSELPTYSEIYEHLMLVRRINRRICPEQGSISKSQIQPKAFPSRTFTTSLFFNVEK